MSCRLSGRARSSNPVQEGNWNRDGFPDTNVPGGRRQGSQGNTTTYWLELLERMLAGLETLPNNESWSWPPLENIIVVSGRVRHSKSESMVTCIKLGSGNPWGEKK